MIPTTTTAVLASIRTAIDGIDPQYAGYDDIVWTYTDIPGAEELRRYYLDIQAPAEWVTNEDRLWSYGEHFGFRLGIAVGYGTLPPNLDRAHLVTQDGVDLWRALHSLIGTVDGLIKIRPDGQEVISDDRKWAQVIWHFQVGYLQQTA